MKWNKLMIFIPLIFFAYMVHGYLDLTLLKSIQDNDKVKIYGRKLLSDLLKQDSLYDDTEYLQYTSYPSKYNDRQGENKRTENKLRLQHYHKFNIPIYGKPKQSQYSKNNCFLSPVQCSFFLP
uniref:Uncharacterized protein n=1 Tax=Parastrongyloides trichosuri TaxID=131310 RepID=A0A0N4ZQ27_PARTI